MPIVDYKYKAKLAENKFYSRDDVSKANKEYVKKFMDAYDVSPARLAIFFRHIYHLLKNTQDIKVDLNDRDKINKVFKQLREELSPSYYATVVNVSRRFTTWLNNGNKPDGFKDIKGLSKKQQRRNLNPDDMITWAEGLKLADMEHSIQWKAILMTQLDGGFRPSEYVDLNFGDIEKKGDFIIAKVRGGKTGARPVILFKSVPYLMRWLKAHPTKKKNDPLWVMEYNNKSHAKDKKFSEGIQRYNYDALRQKLIDIRKNANLEKPLDFYNIRHSACVLAKLDNLPLEECSRKFGHSVKFFTEVYGRLTTEDSIERLSKHYGLKKAKEMIELNRSCSRCGFVNEPKSDVCEQCGSPLSLKKAMGLDKGKDLRIDKLEKEMEELKINFVKSLKSLVKKGDVKTAGDIVIKEGLVEELRKVAKSS